MQASIRSVVNELRVVSGLSPFSASMSKGDYTVRDVAIQSTKECGYEEVPAAVRISRIATEAGLSVAQLELLRLAVERRSYLEAKIAEANEEHRRGMATVDADLKNDPRRLVQKYDAALEAAEAFAKVGGQIAGHVEALKAKRAIEVARAEEAEKQIAHFERERRVAVESCTAELNYLKTLTPAVFDIDGDGIVLALENPRTAIERALAACAADSIAA